MYSLPFWVFSAYLHGPVSSCHKDLFLLKTVFSLFLHLVVSGIWRSNTLQLHNVYLHTFSVWSVLISWGFCTNRHKEYAVLLQSCLHCLPVILYMYIADMKIFLRLLWCTVYQSPVHIFAVCWFPLLLQKSDTCLLLHPIYHCCKIS